MNQPILEQVHKAIRGDRSALRMLVDTYKGLSYALAYRNCKNFPEAQQIAARAWPMLARRLLKLDEPERFLELISWAVQAAQQDKSSQAPQPGSETHSILRTEKVQHRRMLRNALRECVRPEMPVFFLHYVEGLSVQRIAELYGLELQAVENSLYAVCAELALGAGFLVVTANTRLLSQLDDARQKVLICSAELLLNPNDESRMVRLSLIVEQSTETRRDYEAVRQVIELAHGTFAAHRLPDDFLSEVMLEIPLAPASAEWQKPQPAKTLAKRGWYFEFMGFALGIVITVLSSVLVVELFKYESVGTFNLLIVVSMLCFGFLLAILGLLVHVLLPTYPETKTKPAFRWSFCLGCVSALSCLLFYAAFEDLPELAFPIIFLLLPALGLILWVWLVVRMFHCANTFFEELNKMKRRTNENESGMGSQNDTA